MSGEGIDGGKHSAGKFSFNGDAPGQPSAQQQQQQQQAGEDDKYRYKMNYTKRGQCVIINNVNFLPETELEKREGSDIDAENMKTLFESLGFDVEIKRDQTVDDILDIAMNVAADEDNIHKDADCFAMVILSHGDDFGELWGIDEKVLLEEIFANIKYCKTLIGKPKLFFIQACRGNELDEGTKLPQDYETDAGNEPKQQSAQSIPLEADFFYAYSTPPGHYSFRSEKNGAWFIQAINSVFSQYAGTMELTQMMTRVNNMVAYEFTSNCENPHKDKKELDEVYERLNKKKQVSSYVSMLTKELYFTPKHEKRTSA